MRSRPTSQTMARLQPRLTPKHRALIAEQPMFFVATAPKRGRINLSPRGMDTLRCLSATRIAWLDLAGSGNETAAHLLDDGRMTLMWCSFGPKATILRAYGLGRAVQPADDAWHRLAAKLPAHKAARQIIVLEVDAVATSCGFGVPRFETMTLRPEYERWTAKLDADALAEYRRRHNTTSIDGLPTLPSRAGSSRRRAASR